jgi:RsiW-degrading membrane proteinase PrsW (M82 family)
MYLIEALPTVIGTAAIAPALLMLWLVIAAEERPGPPAQVWTAFLLGAASISLLGLARAPFAKMVAAPDNPWAALAMHSIFGVALPEEAVKVVAIVLVSSTKRRTFANPMDTVVYGAAVGLGFAAYENLAYLVQHAEMWRSLAALRSVLTVPFHGALGIIAGAYLTIARAGTALGANRHHRDWARLSSRLLIFAGPLALHSAFDFPLLTLQRMPDLDPTLRMWLGAAPDVGAAARRRRRRLSRPRLRADLDPSLADQPRAQSDVGPDPDRLRLDPARACAPDRHDRDLHSRPQPRSHQRRRFFVSARRRLNRGMASAACAY